MIARPETNEFAPYYHKYVQLVPDGDILGILERQISETTELLGGLSESKAESTYEPGKWTIKEVVGHMADTERVMTFRALWFARNDPNPLPGFEQDDWMRAANIGARRFKDLVAELRDVRGATLPLFRGFDPSTLLRRGTASGVEFTVRSLAYIVAGHERHHLNVLRERYLT
ncbi:MAG: DinB family protein [Gemmatimonadaceae bacterium]